MCSLRRGRNVILPGQYYDVETGLSQNYYRDYDSASGRYVESDPIGLVGGINTYAYVDADPLLSSDPQGLSPNNPWPIIRLLFPMQWSKDRCDEIKKKIDNLNKDIEKRYNDMRLYVTSVGPYLH